ncbi:MAG TPA: hypothetical protein VE465_25145 [Streptosporangiaceae bacterium]|nr:hypothetical protein [Streptosporangiaceae bacterium]
MIMRERIPSRWTISWFRAYDLGDLANLRPQEILESGARAGSTFPDIDAQAFFDIQALRRGHVARMRLAPIRFDGVVRLAEDDQPIHGEVDIHLLAHASGFVVIRPTLRAEAVRLPRGGYGVELLKQLERAFWITEYPLNWHVSDTHDPLPGGGRRLMNWVFLDLYERACQSANTTSTIIEWANEGIQGCDRLHTMREEGRLAYPFPVSFGTQYELVGSASVLSTLADCRETLAQALFGHDDTAPRPRPINLGPGVREGWWFLSENHALTLAEGQSVDTIMDVYNPDRTQLLEFLTLRRGVLRCIQRDTQQVLTERLAVSRHQVERWQHMVASTTDNYVLYDRIGVLIEPARRHINEMTEIRDLGDLEKQVRDNLAWFQERIDTLAEWTGGLIGAAVGTAAMVLSLQEPVKGLLGQVTGDSADEVVNNDAMLFGGVMVVLMALSFALCMLGIHMFTSRLRPFAHDLPTRRLRRRKSVEPLWRSWVRRVVPSQAPPPARPGPSLDAEPRSAAPWEDIEPTT